MRPTRNPATSSKVFLCDLYIVCRLPKLAMESLDAADLLPIMQLEQQPVGSALLDRSRMIIFQHYLVNTNTTAFPLTAAGLSETLNEL